MVVAALARRRRCRAPAARRERLAVLAGLVEGGTEFAPAGGSLRHARDAGIDGRRRGARPGRPHRAQQGSRAVTASRSSPTTARPRALRRRPHARPELDGPMPGTTASTRVRGARHEDVQAATDRSPRHVVVRCDLSGRLAALSRPVHRRSGRGLATSVRAYDVASRRLLRAPVVDTRERRGLMRGEPVTRSLGRGRALGLHALRAARRTAVRPCARHRAAPGVLHRSPLT